MAGLDDDALDELASALELLGSSHAELRARLPPSGYSEEGLIREGTEGLRDAMQAVPELLRSGRLAPGAAADVLACFLFLQGLLLEASACTVEAFTTDPRWEALRSLARVAHAALARP